MENRKSLELAAAERASDLIYMAADAGAYLVEKATEAELPGAHADSKILMDTAVKEGGQILDAAAKETSGTS